MCGTVGECKEGGNDDGIPIIVHTPYFRSGDGCLDGCFGGVNGDERVMFASMEMFLEFSMAAFLVVAGRLFNVSPFGIYGCYKSCHVLFVLCMSCLLFKTCQ